MTIEEIGWLITCALFFFTGWLTGKGYLFNFKLTNGEYHDHQNKIMYYIRRIRWLWNHRDMKDCNSKFRNMEYDIKWNLDRRRTSNENI